MCEYHTLKRGLSSQLSPAKERLLVYCTFGETGLNDMDQEVFQLVIFQRTPSIGSGRLSTLATISAGLQQLKSKNASKQAAALHQQQVTPSSRSTLHNQGCRYEQPIVTAKVSLTTLLRRESSSPPVHNSRIRQMLSL